MRARKEGVTWRNVGGQVVVLDLNESCYLQLNATGALLWERLQEECTEEDLLSLLVDNFDIEVDVARRDVGQFLVAVGANKLFSEIG